MFAGLECLAIEPLVLLHVREIDEKLERRAGEHLIDVWIVVRHREALRLAACAVRPDVAHADELDMR